MSRPAFAEKLEQPGRHNFGDSLYLTVRGPKSARWEFRMRVGGSLKSFWLGSAVGPAAIGLMEARTKRANTWLEQRNKQPATARVRQTASAPAGVTFKEAVTNWLEANPNAWAAKGVVARRGLANLLLAEKDVAKITPADVIEALEGETARQHAEKRGWLAACFAFCKAKGWRTGDNPARFDKDTRDGFAKVPDSEHFPALQWSDLPAALKALPDTEAANAVRFCLLTSARPGAVEGATWSQIKGDNGTTSWEYMIRKGGKLFLQRVPLTKAALALIGERGAHKPNAPLFKLKSNQMLNAFQAVTSDFVAMTSENGIPVETTEKATLHGTARSTFKMWCDDHKDPRFSDDKLSEAALGHYRGDDVHRAYSRGDLYDKRRELMKVWAAFATGN